MSDIWAKIVAFFMSIAAFFAGLFPVRDSKIVTAPANITFQSQTLELGAEEPFRFLHLSDTHLTLADSRDGRRKVSLAEKRSGEFPWAQANLQAAMEKAEELDCFIVHTGDLIDFVSKKNLEAAKDFTDRFDVIMTAGNHEFSLYVGEAKEDAAYRNKSLDQVQAAFKNDIRFYSRKVNGVNLVCIDNGYYLIEQWQLDKLKEELALGMPTILFLHTPLYAEDLYHYVVTEPGTPAYLMSVPEEKMKDYPKDRYDQQKQDGITAQAYELITTAPNIKAIFAGHMHIDFVSMLTPTLPQYITSCTTGRIVTVR